MVQCMLQPQRESNGSTQIEKSIYFGKKARSFIMGFTLRRIWVCLVFLTSIQAAVSMKRPCPGMRRLRRRLPGGFNFDKLKRLRREKLAKQTDTNQSAVEMSGTSSKKIFKRRKPLRLKPKLTTSPGNSRRVMRPKRQRVAQVEPKRKSINQISMNRLSGMNTNRHNGNI